MTAPSYSSDYITPSRNTANIRYAIREVTVLARRLEKAGRRILYLNIGDPNVYDFDLVDEAKEAAMWALAHDKNGYAPSEGLPDALNAIEKDARERQGIRNIVGSYTGNGASECIDLALTALVNPEDNVLLPSPTYPLYATILTRLGVEARRKAVRALFDCANRDVFGRNGVDRTLEAAEVLIADLGKLVF